MSILAKLESMEYGPAPESAKPAIDWLNSHGRAFGHFINGEFTGASPTCETFASRNPATGDELAVIAQAGKADVDEAVAAARAALRGWQDRSPGFRSRCLYALARSIQKHSRLFAVLESLDNGKPIRESRDIDIPLASRHFLYHAGAAKLAPSEMQGRSPVGVCGQIIPWNFPLLMASWKIAPAISVGNTVVLKPAEYTPLTAMLLAELSVHAGIPPGVVNIVNGDGCVGELLTDHGDIDKIAFTGSTEVGRRIRRETAGSGKSLTLELGGKSPFIVFEDADLDSAVEGLVDAIWFNQGEVCCAGSRLLVNEGIAEGLHARIRERMAKLRVGDPLDKCIDIGAIADPVQLSRISEMVGGCSSDDCQVHTAPVEMPKSGCFYPPTLITGLTTSSRLMQEEIFGPVLVSATFRTPDEAVELANNTRYGLAASVWTENINLGLHVAPKLDCGVVWVNSTNLFDAAAGFGGRRDSGFGREGGWEGLLEYTKPEVAPGDAAPRPVKRRRRTAAGAPSPEIDRTPKQYVGGKQARPDSGLAYPVLSPDGELLGHAPLGNRKDVRNAVEAARAATGWPAMSGHQRAQILYFIAENLGMRKEEFADGIMRQTGISRKDAQHEVEASLDRLFTYGAWADKFDGNVHSVPVRGVVLAMREPVGVVGVLCPDDFPLLGPVSLLAPLIAMGNTCVLVPSERCPLSATDLYQVLETSDVPGGVVNIIAGHHGELATTMAGHDGIDSVWHFGGSGLSGAIEHESADNLKRTWVDNDRRRNWLDPNSGEGQEFLHHATDIKNIWIPYGE